MKRIATSLIVLLLLPMSLAADSAVPGKEAPPAEEMALVAAQFLDLLDEDQRGAASFALEDAERKNWHYVPIERRGLSLKKMKPSQRYLAHALINTGLSSRGYTKVMNIMGLEAVLAILENNPERRDPEQYFVSIFGDPKPGGTWAWRFEGHHLSLNFTVVDGKVVAGTPSFLASNPGKIPEGQARAGLRVLEREEDLARDLVKSLDGEQRKKAVIADKAPRDILSKELQKAEHLGDEGIPFTDLKAPQAATLLEIVREYLFRNRLELAKADLKAIEATGLEKIVFAWAGGFEFGQQHYYRIQGPSFLLEYANTQNDAKHVHASWRDFEGDFGEDHLRDHFKAHHRNPDSEPEK